MNKKKIIIAVIAVVAVTIACLLIFGGKSSYQLVISTEESVEGSIENTITATGEIQPVYKVEVGTQVSGIVQHLYVDFNSVVKKGTLLAELDKSTLNEQVKQSKANLSSCQSSKNLAQKNFDRVKALYEKKAATQEEYDQAETELEKAKNQLVTAQSNYENALTNLKYAEIYSPIDGVVLGKEVEEGQTVAASFNTPTLFTIANDLTQMQVEADVDEADIGQVKVGQRVSFTVDAYPNDTFSGTVKQIRLNASVTSNVVTYTVIINAPNPDEKLYPGMTANVNIIVEEQSGIIVPLQATYTTFNEEAIKMLEKEGYTLIGINPSAENISTNAPKNAPKNIPGGVPSDKSSAKVSSDDSQVIYLLEDKTIKAYKVKTGLNDGAMVIVDGEIGIGAKIVLSVDKQKITKKSKESADNPFMMGPPEQKKR